MNRIQNQFVVKLEKRKIGGLGFVVKRKPGSTSAVVTDIVKGSVAQEKGLLQVGDVILEINGTPVTDLAFDQVLEILNGVPIGKEVIMKVKAASSVTQNQQSNSKAEEFQNGSLVNGGIMNGIEQTIQTQNVCPFSGFNPGYKNRKFVRLTNLITGKQITDTLHQKAMETVHCTAARCLGSLMDPSGVEVPTPRAAGVPRPKEEVILQATDFLRQYYASMKLENSPAHKNRLSVVLKVTEETGTYELTEKELAFGAKTAWRNAARCIGRIQWNKLQVFDARHVQTAQEMFEAILAHIRYATNKGNLRSTITIFPQRRELNKDFRVWNFQLIRYAGYKQPDGSVIGDPANVEMTEICQELGWEGPGGSFDILPLVLQANGEQPQVFEIPKELILEIHIKHPSYPWFKELGLRWYALPAVSGLKLDVGGVEFPAIPFNGWYMETEIGRDFTDEQRYNMLEPIAKKLGLDTNSNAALWKDRALVELNAAILYSYQEAGVTLLDHHTASDQFMKHMANEEKIRGGIPADWVWIVPPLSGAATPVFHQEMLNYTLKPSYDYQPDAWKVTPLLKHKEHLTKKKFAFKEVAKAVKFSAKLMGQAMAKRKKALILYASETGKSESYAKMLNELFSYAFDPKVMCMEDYPHPELENEDLVLIVTSTFGNGDPPENGEAFARYLYELRHPSNEKSSSQRLQKTSRLTGLLMQKERDRILRMKDDSQPLANLRFSVFGLGSRAYPNFCAFARSVDKLIKELGGEQILAMAEGDELCGQEEAFKVWAGNVFKASCDTFCVGDDINTSTVTKSLNSISSGWEPNHYRFQSYKGNPVSLCENLANTHGHGKAVYTAKVISVTNLQASNSGRRTLLVRLDTGNEKNLLFHPGDHLAIYPVNREELVQALMKHLQYQGKEDELVTVEMCNEVKGIFGPTKSWEPVSRLPKGCSVQEAFSRFIDITSTPTPQILSYLATQATSSEDKEKLELLGKGETAYEDWKYEKQPNVVEVIEEFTSLKVSALLLLTQLPLMQPRFYSVSSSPDMFPGEIHITVAVVQFTKRGGKGPVHYGVCSNWLDGLKTGDLVPCYVRQAQSFHMPNDGTVPVIMVGPGTGIAPFRSFWQQRNVERKKYPGPVSKSHISPEPSPVFPRRRFYSSDAVDTDSDRKPPTNEDERKDFSSRNTLSPCRGWGEMYLFFGCRNSQQDCIYKDEILNAKNEGAIKECYMAFSREPNQPKRYVQDKLKEVAFEICDMLVSQRGHFYVCGDVSMAADVYRTLQTMLERYAAMSQTEAQEFIDKLKTTGRYHEDIFGVTLRTREVTNRVRAAAKKAWVYVSERKIIRARSSSTSKSIADNSQPASTETK